MSGRMGSRIGRRTGSRPSLRRGSWWGLAVGGTLAILGMAPSSAQSSSEGTRGSADSTPNIVCIVVDDLGWTDIRCFGSSFYDTPNVDRLAMQGMRFTNGYASCPVCSPTRAALMTGRVPTRYAVTDYINPAGGNQPEKWKRKTPLLPASFGLELPHGEWTIAEALREEGYATFFAGKWHLGSEGHWPTEQGFDHNQGGWDTGGPYTGKRYFSPYDNPTMTNGPDGEHLPDRLASETVKFIEGCDGRPFLAYLSFYSVHTPLMARADLKAKYEERRKGRPATWGKEGQRKVREVQEHAIYAGMVEAMDQAVGKVLDALDRLELTDNTLVFFTSDNGGLSTSEGHPTSNLPLRAGKGWLYEGGVRVPWIARWPGVVEAGSMCHEPIASIDLMPTVLAAVGASTDIQMDGVDLRPLLNGGTLPQRDLYWHYPHYGNQGGRPGGAIRAGDWKLIEFFGDSGESDDRIVELYDLDNDFGETTDLAATQPERVQELLRRLRAWQTQTGARFPTRNTRKDS